LPFVTLLAAVEDAR